MSRARPYPWLPTRKISSKLGVEEFLRVKLGQVGDRHRGHPRCPAVPEPSPASPRPTVSSASRASRKASRTRTAVVAELIKPLSTIRNTIVIVGSHDNTLDVLADELRAGDAGLTLSSSHVGSMGGLMAVKRGTVPPGRHPPA